MNKNTGEGVSVSMFSFKMCDAVKYSKLIVCDLCRNTHAPAWRTKLNKHANCRAKEKRRMNI